MFPFFFNARGVGQQSVERPNDWEIVILQPRALLAGWLPLEM
jgi:hypothetical protein